MTLPRPPATAPDAPWKLRFDIESVLWVTVAVGDPKRGAVCINRGGPFQVYAWDLATDELRQLSFRDEGLANACLSPDGRWLLYLDDRDGSEIGHHVRTPWEGGLSQDLASGLPPYASFSAQASVDGSTFVTVAADDGGNRLLAADLSAEDPHARIVWSTEHLCVWAAVSAGGDRAIIPVASHSREPRFDLVSVDLSTGDVVGELWDGDGTSIELAGVSPVPGDARVVATSDRSGFHRPLLWDPTTNDRRDLAVPDAEGDIDGVAWSPSGRLLALKETWRAEERLWLYDLDDDRATRLSAPAGTYTSLAFVDDDVIAACRNAWIMPGHVVMLGVDGSVGRPALAGGTAPAPAPIRSVGFAAADGDRLQAWVSIPEGQGPFPTVIETHGGPHGAMQDVFYPPGQVWTDHGYAYLSLNYRGSTSFGRDFMEKIWGRPGDLEVDDLEAARDWLVGEGIADPTAILLTGWSYGGYLTLQGLGRRPELWAGGMAGVAIADWRLTLEDSNDLLRGFIEALLGGTPAEADEAYRMGSPITYVEDLAAPALIIQGRNDSRCPARQVETYVERALAAGKRVEVDWFDSGHAGWTDVAETRRQIERMLVFADAVLGDAAA